MPPAARAEIDGGDVVLIDVRDPSASRPATWRAPSTCPSGESARDAHDAAYAEAIEEAGATAE